MDRQAWMGVDWQAAAHVERMQDARPQVDARMNAVLTCRTWRALPSPKMPRSSLCFCRLCKSDSEDTECFDLGDAKLCET